MIYCLEDDANIREMMLYTLQMAGFTACGFGESGEFWKAVQKEKPELVLLDIMLPGEDGLTVLKRLRTSAATAGIPVIMTTAKGSEYDKVFGLDTGADDYLVKPFGMMEMISRVKAVLRRTTAQQAQILSVCGLSLNLSEHTVTANGAPVSLALKEYELLTIFMEHPGQAFTREALMAAVWGGYTGETRTVDVHIGTLRRKLEGCGALIQTVRGIGYRLQPAIEGDAT